MNYLIERIPNMLPELDPKLQDWRNPYINLPMTPYHIILAGEGVKNV